MLGLVPVGSAPIGILSLSIRNVANRDVEVDGWRSGATGALEAGNVEFNYFKTTTFFSTNHSVNIVSPSANQTLILWIRSAHTVTNLQDNKSGTYVADNISGTNSGYYRRTNGDIGGTLTVTWNSSSADTCRFVAFYLTGAANALDSSAVGTTPFSTSISLPITTTSNNALVLANIQFNSAGDPTVIPSGSTNSFEFDTDNFSQFMFITNAGIAGAKTLTGTWSVASNSAYQVVAYRPVQTSAVLADNLDEDTPDNSDYAYSPNLDDRQAPLVMALNNPLEAGTYTFNFTAQKETEWGQVKLTLLDSNLTSVGSSSWTGLVDRVFNTYSVTATTTGTSAFIKVEARSDASLVVDFTDPDKINPLVKNYSNSIPGQAESMNGMYLNKYGFLTSNWTNFLYNSSRLNQLRNFTGATAVLDVEYAPDLSFTADKLVEDTSTGEHFVRNSNTTVTVGANRVITYSVRLKSAGRQHCRVSFTASSDFSAVFTLTGVGAISSATNLQKSSITALSNGWYLCTITFLNTALTTNAQAIIKLQSNSTTTSYTGNGTSGVFVWGQQAQYGWNPTNFDSDPTLQDYGYSWRIAHGNDYVYKSNNKLPTPAPGTTFSGISDVFGGSTFESRGTELVVKSGDGTSGQFTQSYSNANQYVEKGKSYEIVSTRRNVAGTLGSNLDWYNGASFTSIGYIGQGTTATRTALTSYSINAVNSFGFVYAFYPAGIKGEVGGVQTLTLREIERKPIGLPIEQYCGNSLLWSGELTNTSWTAVGVVPALVTDTVSPSGDLDAWELPEDGGFGSHYISQSVNFTQGTTAVLSVFFQAGSIQLRADDAIGGFYCNYLNAGQGVYTGNKDATSTATVEYLTSNWCRASLAFVPTTSGVYPVYVQVITNNASTAPKNQQFSGTLYPSRVIWGPQVDHTNTGDQFKPTLYKPTQGSPSYASNVGPLVELSNDFYTVGTPFTVYLEFGVCGRKRGMLWSAGQPGNNIDQYYINHETNNKLLVGLESTPTQSFTSTNDFDLATINYIAVRFEPGNYAISLNGVITISGITKPIPTTWTRIILGNTYNFGQSSNAHLRRFKFYNRALSDGELLNLTAGDPDQNAGVNLLTTSW